MKKFESLRNKLYALRHEVITNIEAEFISQVDPDHYIDFLDSIVLDSEKDLYFTGLILGANNELLLTLSNADSLPVSSENIELHTLTYILELVETGQYCAFINE